MDRSLQEPRVGWSIVIILAITALSSCGGQQTTTGGTPAPPQQVDTSTAVAATPVLGWYDAQYHVVSGSNPVLSTVAIGPSQVQAGTVVHVVAAAYQAGTVDPTLQVGIWMSDINGNIFHHVYGPEQLQQAMTCAVDILFYANPDGSVSYKLSGLGSEVTWEGPDTVLRTPGSMIDGDGPENLSQPILIQMRVEGDAQPASQVTSAHLFARTIP
jgi:hypothetical protein